MKTALYWLPRVLGILSILYIGVFALDVFTPGVPIREALLGLAIHLLPNSVLVVVLAVAWKHERVGGLLFILVSLLPFLLLRNPTWVNTLLAGPFFVTGVLFLASAQWRQRELVV